MQRLKSFRTSRMEYRLSRTRLAVRRNSSLSIRYDVTAAVPRSLSLDLSVASDEQYAGPDPAPEADERGAGPDPAPEADERSAGPDPAPEADVRSAGSDSDPETDEQDAIYSARQAARANAFSAKMYAMVGIQ